MKFVRKKSAAERRGLSLGGALLAVSVLALLAFTLASLSVSHLQLSSRQEHGLAASNVARSVVSQAISRILQAKEFGEARLADEEIRLETSESLGLLTFHERTAQRERLPYSTNNLNRTEDTHGADDILVPSATVHLVGVGRSAGVERRVEAVLRLPPFPWAIASGGRVETRNGVLIAALPHGVWPPPTDEKDLLPADLLANGTDAQAVVLASGSTILGDVETPGQVVRADGVQVRGEIRTGSSKADLPTLLPTDYDPRTAGREHFTVTGAEEELTGSARGQGVVTFSQPLTLSNAHLFVEGDLRLSRGVSGSGIIVATGDITVEGAALLDGLTEVAVVSGGTVRLSGHGSASSRMRGLFYAEDGLQASELTLVGSLLTGQASTGVTLSNVNMYYSPPGTVETVTPGGIGDGGLAVNVTPVLGTVLTFISPVGNDSDFHSTESTFYVDLQPEDGDFPVTVTIRSGLSSFNMPPRVVNDIDEIDDYLAEVSTAIAASPNFEYPPTSTIIAGQTLWWTPSIDEAIPVIENAIRNAFKGSESSTTPGSQTSTLFADISRFLPIEDRIRVVSWIER